MNSALHPYRRFSILYSFKFVLYLLPTIYSFKNSNILSTTSCIYYWGNLENVRGGPTFRPPGLDQDPNITDNMRHINFKGIQNRNASIWIQCAFYRVLRTPTIDSSRKRRWGFLLKSPQKTSYCDIQDNNIHDLKREKVKRNIS